MQKYLVIALVFFILVAVFVAFNNALVTVNLLFARYQISLAVIILISVLIGALLTFLLSLVDKFKKRSEINSYKKQLAEKEQRIIDQRKEIDKLMYPTNTEKKENDDPSAL